MSPVMQFDSKHPELGWHPTVPLPLYVGWWKRCSCGKRFLRLESYEDHWLALHFEAEQAAKNDGEDPQADGERGA